MSEHEPICEREISCVREVAEPVAVTGEKLTGYAVVYNQRSVKITDWAGTYYEVIDPDAFDLNRKISFNFRHDDNAEYGDTDHNLKLFNDEKGIRFELDLPPYATTLRNAIRNGLIKGMSFGYNPRDVYFDKDGVRHVRKGQLKHISPVYNPAFPQTSVGLSTTTNDIKRKRLDLLSKM